MTHKSEQTHHHNPHHGGEHHFDPARLLNMESEWQRYMSPATILPQFLTRQDMTLLDLGCGAGYFAIPAAKMLRDESVYAVDILEWDRVDTESGPPMEMRICPDTLSATLMENDYEVREVAHLDAQPAVYWVHARIS